MTYSQSIPVLILRTARPLQWIKNFALYAALVFSGFLFFTPGVGSPYLYTVTYAFVLFCCLTSSIYIINDILDIEADSQHPYKRKRPIASGQLPIPIALFSVMTLLAIFFLGSLWLPTFFRLLALMYICLQILYATVTKHIPILDVLSIATGFLIRIYAGAVVVDLHMSVWFLLTVISSSLFLAVGKRQSERTLMAGLDTAHATKEMGNTRASLKRYSQRLLDQYTGMFATTSWLTYALFAFQNEVVRPDESLANLYTVLPRTLQSQKLLMLTVPFVIFGIMRYLQLVYEDNEGESPEKVLLRDKPLLATAVMFASSVIIVIYFLS
jgi:4-hydroxybenzoate polyprenyltransferase